MSWIDVAILALVVLVGLLGLWKGVKKSALALGAFVISFLLAFFLANVIAEAMLGIDSIKEFVLGKNGVGPGSQWSLAKMIYDGLGDSALSDRKSFLGSNFFAPILDMTKHVNTALAAQPGINAEKAGVAICGAFMMFSAICGVGIFLVVRFLLIIVTVVVKSFIGKKNTVLTRLFGFLVGAIRGALWVFAFTVVFSTMGGYTFLSGINAIEKEYEENAVVCGTFNDWAYGLRNKLLLPNGDMYGRLVDMVYKKDNSQIANKENLAPNELKLFVGISNLNYDGAPHGIDELKHRTFDMSDPNIKVRRASEFAGTGFYKAAKAILDYNTQIADKIDNQKTGLNQDKFATLANIVTGGDAGTESLDDLMNKLWKALRDYEEYFAHPDTDKEESVNNSTLQGYYNKVLEAMEAFKTKYKLLSDEIDIQFPELDIPNQKHVGDEPDTLPDDAEEEPEAPGNEENE